MSRPESLFGGPAVAGMRGIMLAVFVLLLAWHGSVLAQTFKPIDNPEKFAAGVVETIANGASNDAARSIIEAVGQPASLSSLQSALHAFDGKKFNFSKKVIDNEISGSSDHSLLSCRKSWICLLPFQLQDDQ